LGLPISGLAAAQYLAADFSSGSGIVVGYQFLDRQRHRTWLPISKSAAVKLLAADF